MNKLYNSRPFKYCSDSKIITDKTRIKKTYDSLVEELRNLDQMAEREHLTQASYGDKLANASFFAQEVNLELMLDKDALCSDVALESKSDRGPVLVGRWKKHAKEPLIVRLDAKIGDIALSGYANRIARGHSYGHTYWTVLNPGHGNRMERGSKFYFNDLERIDALTSEIVAAIEKHKVFGR